MIFSTPSMFSKSTLSKSTPSRLIVHICWLLLAANLLIAHSWAQDSQTAVLKIANTGEPATLDPHKYNLRLEETLLNDLFMGLTTFAANGEIVPGVAERWETSVDGLTWTFHLRQTQWSDGTPVTSAEFVFAFRRLQDPNTAASLAYFMDMLKHAAAINQGKRPLTDLGVRAADKSTLILELEKPYPYLLERLLYPTAFPVPEHVISRQGDDWVKPANFVGNGAYILKEWAPQAAITLQANVKFEPQAQIEQVQYLPIDNEQTAYNRFRNNEVQAIGSFPVGELATLQASDHPALRVSNLLSMFYLVFNTRETPFNDVRVRRALSLAIDQRTLTDQVMRSGSQPAFSFVPPVLADYSGVPLPHQETAWQERLALVKNLLTEAGYTNTNTLNVTLRHVSIADIKKVNLAITGMWKQVGVNALLQQADMRTHFGDLRQGDFQVAWAGWVGG